MPSAEHERVEELFSAAIEHSSAAERTAYLRGACGQDVALRERMEELLAAHDEASSFLDVPAIDPHETVSSAAVSPVVDTQIGPYKIRQKLGEGGFGAVYLAEQQAPVRREVALKILKLGMDTRQVIARFEVERQALALMDHPNIAHVLDAGATDTGRPYFVMELVRGVTITDYCDNNRLTIRQRLELFPAVCDAVQHAHQKGIIHRDIKPSNVLITLHNGKPLPKVIDFGIAKATTQRLTDKTLFTEFHQFIGTPEYMSPDQATQGGLDIDTRTDIYSLGVLLYTLLTGHTPFGAKHLRKAGLEEIRRIICQDDPPRPSARVQALDDKKVEVAERRRTTPLALLKQLHGDLDWIVMKAMEKDRARRYQTAAELVKDIERHLRCEPVSAGPPGVSYRLSKFVRRNRAAVLVGTVVCGALLAGLSLATVGYIQATRAGEALKLERDAANAARIDAERARAAERDQRREAEAAAAEARAAAAKATAVNAFLGETLASVDPSRALGRQVTVRYALDEAARKIAEGALAGQPEVEADVRMSLGKTYQALGLFDAAEVQLQQATALRAQALGAESIETLRAQSALAGVLNNQGRRSEAETLARATAGLQARVAGPEHAETLATLNELGIALARQDRLAEAEEIHRRVFEAQQRVLGAEHTDTLRSLANLGRVYHAQGLYAEAELLLRQALDLQRDTLGEEHPDVMQTMNSLARTLESQRKYAAAETLYRETWELDRRILGPDHPHTQIPMNNLLRVLRSQGNVDEMRPLTMERLARSRRAAEQPDAAALALNAYAWELLTCEPADLRNATEAVTYARRAVELDGSRNADFLQTLALAYEQTGDLEQAIDKQRLAVARARTGGPYNRAELEKKLVDMLLAQGSFLEATAFSLGVVAADVGESVSADYTAIGASLVQRADELMREGRFAEAEPLLYACLATRQKSLPAGHWSIAEAQSLLGAAKVGQGMFAQAEPVLLNAYKDIADNPQAPRRVADEARARVVSLYDSWGKADEAEAWRQHREHDGE